MGKLIILRGPSGSGKTTTAKNLLESSKRKTCLIQQDYYRSIFKPKGCGSKRNSDTIHKMIEKNVIITLEDGYDVILEGILSVKSYGEVLDRIFKRHPRDNYIFYFNVSLEESIRRHRTKPDEKKQGFTEDDIREWYPAAHQSNHRFEYIIPESHTPDQAVAHVKEVAGV